jgi:hypothetical protein
MALTTTCRFVCDPNKADKGRIVVEARQTPSIAPDYWEMYVKITDPLGNVIVTAPSLSGPGNFQVTGTTLAYFNACPLPQVNPSLYLSGVYRVEIWKRLVNDSLPAAVKICDENYNFLAHNTPFSAGTANSRLTFTQGANCTTDLITVVDTTDYTALGFTRTSNALRIDNPNGSTAASGWPSISTAITQTQVTYSIRESISYTYDVDVAVLDANTSVVGNAGVINTIPTPITCEATLSNEIKFVTDPLSSDKGRITFSTVSVGFPIPAVGYEIYVKITEPTGVILNAPPPFSGPGDYLYASGSPGTWWIGIPLDSNGNYLSGDYLIELWSKTPGAAAGTEVKILTATYNFCPHNVPSNTANNRLSFSETLSCVTGNLTVTDLSLYSQAPDFFVQTFRDLRISPPLIDGRAAVFTSSNTLTLTVQWTNVIYGISEKVSYEYNVVTSYANNTFKSLAGVINFIEYAVNCDSSICATVECLGTYFTDLEARACANGGWSRLTAAEQGNFAYVSAMVNLANMSLTCGNVTNYELYLNKAKAILNDCNCGCAECSDDPKPFVPVT